MAESRDVAWDLAELVAGAGFGDLTNADVAATERLVLDTIATTMAGSAEPPFPTLLEHYRAEGGRGHATVMVHGGRLPVEHVVVMNSEIEYEDTTTGQRRRVRLVYPSEANTTDGRVSVLAPLGCALLGLQVGHEIDWRMPGGVRRLRVLAVTPPAPTERR